MSANEATYKVVCQELLRRAYRVTTAGGETRAAWLAEGSDYLAPAGESCELIEDEDFVCDFAVIEIVIEEDA
jgi:hypothetical protein